MNEYLEREALRASRFFLCHPHQASPASPLKGEAVVYANLTHLNASPLRGEAG